ncbi:MBL fold metallo-hydrolase [Glaciecola siphonariae]|uniref:MBL fold metallo-hydrolase n=1 Tax=Glaciecola siphonariae TaxID=521012 RepID=A0ABV9LXY5_9ALTE
MKHKVFVLISIMLVWGLFSCATSSVAPQTKNKSHHVQDGFRNLYIEDSEKNFFDFLKMRFLGEEEWADHAKFASDVPVQDVNIAALRNPPEAMQVTWLGHAMFLIQYQGQTILTDPIFTDRASPIPFAGPKRYVRHAMDYAQLPNIDAVLISHNHYDHLDTETLERLSIKSKAQSAAIRFYVPLGLKPLLSDSGVPEQDIQEMDWWDTSQTQVLKVHALPSQHWSARGTTDRRETLWASWAVEINGRTIWFAGDTGYNDVQFKQIGQYLNAVDLALIPIGAYEPRWFMQQYHVNPSEALQIHKDINSKFSVGMHWGTFPLTAEMPLAPVNELKAQRQRARVSPDAFDVMAIGETRILKMN